MKVAITITKQEIEEAVRDFIFERASTGYRHEFGDAQLSFMNSDGDIGNFTCITEAEIIKKEEK